MKRKLTYILLGLVIFYLTSLQHIYLKFTYPGKISIIYLLFGFLILHSILNDKFINWIERIIPSKLGFVILIFYIFVFSVFIIHKYELNILKNGGITPQTADDAMILPAKSFWAGFGMYEVKTNDGAPISPGPGWIILNSLFSISDFYVLINSFWLLLFNLLLFNYLKSVYAIFLSLTILSTSLAYLALTSSGYDITAISFAIGVCYILTKKISIKNSYIYTLLLAFLVGMVSTSRIVFIIIPFILFLSLKDKKYSYIFLLSALVFSISWHSIFYSISSNYQPFHLFQRGQSNVGKDIILIGIIIEFFLGLLSIFKYYKSKELLLWGIRLDLLFLFCPLLLISFGELRHNDFNFKIWEGANYLIPTWGLFIIILLEERIPHVLPKQLDVL